MITRAARFSINEEEAALRKKFKTCNEEVLMLKLQKGNNLIIFYGTTFEEMKHGY